MRISAGPMDNGIIPVTSITSDVPVLARQLGSGWKSPALVVAPVPELLERLMNTINSHGGFSMWLVRDAWADEIAAHDLMFPEFSVGSSTADQV